MPTCRDTNVEIGDLADRLAKSVTNISNSSLTHLVSNIDATSMLRVFGSERGNRRLKFGNELDF